MRRASKTRLKGTTFEREVARAFEDAGFSVRGIEQGGDHFAVSKDGLVVQVEAKRHERLRLPEWIAQMEADHIAGCASVLVFRQSRCQSYVVQSLEQYLAKP